MTVAETSFTTAERYVERGAEYYNVTITVRFQTPPLVLNPGLRYKIRADFTHGGTYKQGGEGLGEQFSFSVSRGYQNILDPQTALRYYPWSQTFSGATSQEWMVTAPPVGRAGDTFLFYAGLWNRAPCNVTWTYRAEYH